MRIFDAIVQELFRYRSGAEDPSPVALLGYAFDLAYAENKVNTGLIAEFERIHDRSGGGEWDVPLDVLEFIYRKNRKSQTTGRILHIRRANGTWITKTLSELIAKRGELCREILRLQNAIIRKYDIQPIMRKESGGGGRAKEIERELE